MSHEIWETCPRCGEEYDAHLHWSVCPNCGFDSEKDGKKVYLRLKWQLPYLHRENEKWSFTS